MKSTKLFLSVIAIGAITFSGCKKDKNESNTDKLTDKNWKMTAYTVDPGIDVGGGVIVTDFYAQFLQDCNKDDLTKFLDDNKVNFDEGPTKCNASDDQTTIGSWAWNSDETVLSITDDVGDVTSYTIISLSSSEMKGKFTEDIGGVVYTETVTYKAQ